MQRVAPLDKSKILYQIALGRDSLRPHARSTGGQIGGLDLGHQSLQRPAK